MSDHHGRQDALNQFWNALIGAEGEAPEADVTPEEMKVVQRLQRAGTAPHAGLSAEAAWPRVLARIEAQRVAKEAPMALTNVAPLSSPIMLPNGRATDHVPPPGGIAPARGLGRWAWGRFTTALLLLITVGLGYLALRPGTPLSHRQAALPAPVALATPAPGRPAVETLLDLPIPAAMIPRGDPLGASLAHYTLPPGTTTTWDVPQLRVDYVLAGRYTVRSEGSVQIVRAGGIDELESIPAGTETTLGPGDAMIAPRESTSDYTNPGPDPADLLTWGLNEGAPATRDPTPRGWMTHNVDLNPQPPLPPGAGRMRLRRIELAAEEVLSPPPGTLQLAVTLPENAAGTPTPGFIEYLKRQSGNAIRNFGSEPATVYVVTLEPAAGTATP